MDNTLFSLFLYKDSLEKEEVFRVAKPLFWMRLSCLFGGVLF